MNTADTAGVQVDKAAAQRLILKIVLPLQQKLLRSFDPATVDVATGNNALHEMCTLFSLSRVSVWSYKLTERLIYRGVSVHARNKEGRTPLLQLACTSTDEVDSAVGIRLLLAHGADLNAQDGEGNGLLHFLVRDKAEAVLADLLGCDGVNHMDCALRNSAGHTAADLSAISWPSWRTAAPPVRRNAFTGS